MSDNNMDIWQAIAAPLDPKQIKVRKQTNKRTGEVTAIRYISRDAVIYRLNQVCPGEWDFRVEMISAPGADTGWVCKGTLTIRGVSREDFGVPDNEEYFDPPKAAASDALKRCASQFGFALELYGEEPPAPGNDSQPASKPAKNGKALHWIDDSKKRTAFWGYTQKELGLSEPEVYEALGVRHIHDYAGTMAQAKEALDLFADSKPRGEE